MYLTSLVTVIFVIPPLVIAASWWRKGETSRRYKHLLRFFFTTNHKMKKCSVLGRQVLWACWYALKWCHVLGDDFDVLGLGAPGWLTGWLIWLIDDWLNGCVRLASLGRPRSAPARSNSFDGLTWVSPQCPACGVGHLGVTWGACRHHERASVIVRLALVRGLTRVSTAGYTPREALRTHPML